MRFWLGTHMPSWLWALDDPVDLFVSHRRLARRVTPFPPARSAWALDSGGFTELTMHGRWVTSQDEYADAVARYADQLGPPEWVAPQDWMCEPHVLAETGRSVGQHQWLTVRSVVELRARLDVPVIPVLQGWTRADYERCLDVYADAGFDLAAEPLVGLGSVCRRQNTSEIEGLVVWLHSLGLSLHGFGIKTSGLDGYGWALTSADSLAWSYRARRREGALDGCDHASCSNCPRFALRWRERVLRRLDVQQTSWAF